MTAGPASLAGRERTADELAQKVVRAMVEGDIDAYIDVSATDVLLDLVVPFWRYQLVGHDALRLAFAEEFLPGREVVEQHVTRTADGVLIELGATGLQDGQRVTWWDIHHIRFRDGDVSEHIAYCSGLLDDDQLRRQQVEAPWVRQR
ncbi:MAG TPA: nuclear transport factor 2 family protein [Candidatus Nanopelagicales bacterium]|nr:nuclear transport factor 2 family protein [Candidatus Nanopelagicales bacterium]